MDRSCLAPWLVLALAWGPGCSPAVNPPPPSARVKGTIELDGKPVPTGELHFGRPGVPPGVVAVTDGTFSGDAPVGKNKVEFYHYVDGPSSAKYGGVATKTNSAPGKYWGPNTVLEATVEAGGDNDFKFTLSSK